MSIGFCKTISPPNLTIISIFSRALKNTTLTTSKTLGILFWKLHNLLSPLSLSFSLGSHACLVVVLTRVYMPGSDACIPAHQDLFSLYVVLRYLIIGLKLQCPNTPAIGALETPWSEVPGFQAAELPEMCSGHTSGSSSQPHICKLDTSPCAIFGHPCPHKSSSEIICFTF